MKATQDAAIPSTAARANPWRGRRISHRSGFWAVAAAFLVATSFTVVTTPLWSIYQERDHFSTFMVTVAFASYAVGVLISLFLAGHVSDWMGRRTIMLPAVLLEALAAVGFLFWNDLPGLIVARLVTGLGLGMFTATATAHIAELHSQAHPDRGGARADIVATAANIGGFGIGVFATSLLVQFAPAPLSTPYVVFLVLLLLAASAIALTPETVSPPAEPRRYRPQRVQIPAAARTRYFAAAAIAFAAFAVLGLFTSLAPSFISDQLHYSAPLVAGTVVLVTFASAAGLQIGVRRLSLTAGVVTGVALYVAGFAAIITAVSTATLALFLIGGALAGGAAGILFSTAISAAGEAAMVGHRGEALAGIFLSAYAGLAVPVVGLGAATLVLSMLAALSAFSVAVVAIAIIGAAVFITHPVQG
ncbi:MFS transporter [Tomitella gaofuii]|uniref:MFS transporter n=1 Tax=Tomitella gaofuii TaxID=2760083 RepID=UPI0015F9BBCE|nr:MFS transporter [Tomitella gaofuii]